MKDLLIALSNLSGESGRQLCTEIVETNKFTISQYEWILNNITFNSKESICENFGTIHYYYLFLNNTFAIKKC